METILLPVIALTAIGLLLSLLLVLAAKFLAVKNDETFEKIRECLPGVNCSACTYPSCDEYAKAIQNGERTNRCIPGGDAASQKISEILGTKFEDVIEQSAYVACSGNCDVAPKEYNYDGVRTCAACSILSKGEKACDYACLGYGDCIKACQYDAIHIVNGVAKVDKSKCVGCGMCTKVCPNHVIHLIDQTNETIVSCSNENKGIVTRQVCKVGCIACKRCEKACISEAIKVVDNLARIDYTKCTNCKACIKECPTNAIREYLFCDCEEENRK